ncbi:hypothetical protein N7468_003349 [Penicillium chermesinum]|uniref:Uncharacterized protein n=1 Tax=Penicillium chermesinum TaxID=63820 RepID=A0A9W9P6I5_9EURO|nr:uncharacterized protein N7468_003349 [Penicillium chermesinum]KAJ5238730.1 hypothetical protein N7468_003349 [Penicillium chermesinum]KAJ6164376.1 hypothetical protein N7470_003048 [Penicillium chermesinum]
MSGSIYHISANVPRWRGPSRQSSQRNSGAGNRDRAQGGHGGSQGNNTAWATSASSQAQHVPVRGFNATEAKNILKREPKAVIYKPTGKDANNQRSGSPWGSKANTMVNGKDFFVELRKQVASLQRGGPPVGG